MSRRSLAFGASTLLLCALLIGCGDQPSQSVSPTPDTSAPTPDPSPSPNPTPSPAPAPSPNPTPGPPPPPAPGGAQVPGPLATASYPYALTLSVDRSDAASALEKLYSAKVVEFNPAAGYALLATQSKILPSDPKPRWRSLENNQNRLNGGGMTAMVNGNRSVWVTGGLTTWTSGNRSVWVTGKYQPVPGNTAAFQQIGLEQAQKAAPRLGRNVTVAVIDSGVDLNHPALSGSLVPASAQYDFYDDDALPQDADLSGKPGTGHGTAVSSIVLQVAPGARIMPLRALGPDGSGDILSVARAVDWAAGHGANIINLSLGAAERSAALQAAIDRAAARGVYVVVAAGNENHRGLDYPAQDAGGGKRASLELSVGSVNSADLKSAFSNYDSGLEMVAPGENIGAAYPGNALAVWSGTSMAAPLVSGALALALGEGLSGSGLADRLTKNAAKVDNLSGNKPYKGMLGDKGRLDIQSFLKDALKHSDDHD